MICSVCGCYMLDMDKLRGWKKCHSCGFCFNMMTTEPFATEEKQRREKVLDLINKESEHHNVNENYSNPTEEGINQLLLEVSKRRNRQDHF